MKSSFSNLPALKTPVDRHPIGRHARSPFQNSLLCALRRQDFYVFLLKTFLFYDSEQFDVNIIEIHFIWGEL